MLDIIIPTYKNKEGLKKTLSSIDLSLLEDINITIIDDCSQMFYEDIFEEFPFITIFYNRENSGPGYAREVGIQVTENPYIMFIDTGDYFINNEVQETILTTIKQNPKAVMFSWQYKMNGKISDNTNNRLHGRVYKREFINTYKIDFCLNSSYTNEDIGFNRLCRLIIKDKKLDSIVFTEPVLIYAEDKNSITNKNNGEFFFKQQNKGLALNTIHTIQKAEQNRISKTLILEEISAIMASLYYTFLCTMYERPEFIQEAWDGAKIFYDRCFIKYLENDSIQINTAYSVYVKRIYSRAKQWKNFKPLNFIRFLKDLKNYKQIPSWYNI